MTVEKICIHHSGGLGFDNYASTAILTFNDINQAHKERWNFKSSLGYYAGYNVVYDPKDRSFTQARALGEETCAQKGHNFDTFSLCIIGNYNLKPNGEIVDTFFPHTQMDVTNFLIDLCKGNYRGLTVAPDTTLRFRPNSIHPHRYYGDTDCYGTGIRNEFFREQVELRYYPQISNLQKLLDSLRSAVLLLQAQVKTLGKEDRECDGRV